MEGVQPGFGPLVIMTRICSIAQFFGRPYTVGIIVSRPSLCTSEGTNRRASNRKTRQGHLMS